MNLYIYGAGILSAAGNNSEKEFLKNPPAEAADRLLCQEPDYTPWIPPMQLRRMSKAVRMGIGAARLCLQEAGEDKPDAISVGSALGCLQDTENFLSKMTAQNEQMLTPTAFIQSTHNTVAGQIALLTGCRGQNFTFVHRGHSFEQAMINARLFLNAHPDKKILVGGIEELTETSLEVFQLTGIYRKEKTVPERLLKEISKGSTGGEGAGFFLVSRQPEGKNNLLIKNIGIFTSADEDTALQKLNDFLAGERLKAEDTDLVIMGANGDRKQRKFYKELRENLFRERSQAAFKHFSGEYPVASSFALGMAFHALRNGLQDHIVLNHFPEKLNRILLINHFSSYYSCWILEAV